MILLIMGIVYFTHLGEIANAGRADGIDGRVQQEIEKLPKDTFYWLTGENPTSMAPYAEFKEGIIVIDVKDDLYLQGGRPSIGIKLPADSEVLHIDNQHTLFEYQRTGYKVVHKTVPFYEEAPL